jgi:hypothetical protein
MRAAVAILCAALLASLWGGASAQMLNLTQWSMAIGGNDHWYGVMSGGLLQWYEAAIGAYSQVLDDDHGYLATITSQAENDFVYSSIVAGVVSPDNFGEFWLGGYRPSQGVWHWYSGEEWDYTNWDVGEPNYPGEDCVAIRGEFTHYQHHPDPHGFLHHPSYWNNVHRSQYPMWSVVEWGGFDPDPIVTSYTPEPSPLLLLGLGMAAFVIRRSRKREAN